MGTDGKCTHWINDELDNSVLTESKYITSKKTFGDMDYSGFSLYNKYSISNYVYLIFPNHTDAYVAYQTSDRLFAGEYAQNGCFNTAGVTNYDGDVCGSDDGGRCFAQKCLYPIDGAFNNQVKAVPTVGTTVSQEQQDAVVSQNVEDMLTRLEPGTCKSYPEATSPFDVSLAIDGNPQDSANTDVKSNSNLADSPTRSEYKAIKKQYQNAKICQFDGKTGGDCSCDYIKVEYKDGSVDYWSRDTSAVIPAGICSGLGDVTGLSCNTDNDCKSSGDVNSYGTCNLQKSQGNYIGLKGLCLEYDLSRPLTTINTHDKTYQDFACLTWLPIQESATSYDLYNQNPEAGYYPVAKYDSAYGGLSYCIESTSFGMGFYDKDLVDFNDRIDNVSSIKDVKISNDISYSDVFNLTPKFYAFGDSLGVDGYVVHNLTTDFGASYESYPYVGYLQSGNKEYVYKMMQLWGWKNLSPTARLLRVDMKNADDYKQMAVDFSSVPDVMDAEPIAVFGFALSLRDSDTAGYEEDTGTIMHPPRLDSDYNPPNGSLYNYFMNPNKSGTADLPWVESSAFSPDIKTNDYLYTDRDVEKNLNEYLLNRVYFVPTYFPKGSEGPNPSTLNNNYYIDFNKLRFGLTKGTPYDINKIDAVSGNYRLSMSSQYTDTKNFEYVLQRHPGDNNNCESNGLVSYCNYDGIYNPVVGVNNIDKELNSIYRRYVALFFNGSDSGGSFPFGDNLQLPSTKDILGKNNDPFTTGCQATGSNWLAIGMDFNEKGQFLGYISRWCNGSKSGSNHKDNGINFATFADLQDVCLDVASVVNKQSNLLGDYNKAWTDRVWSGASDFTGWAYNQVKHNSSLVPYMSLQSGVVSDETLDNTFDNLSIGVKYYSFPDDSLGLPYNCVGSVFPQDYANLSNTIFNTNMSCAGIKKGNKNLINEISTKANPDPAPATLSLQKLFKKFYTEWGFSLGVDSGRTLQRFDIDVSGQDLGLTQAPKIFAINYATCGHGLSETNCRAAKEGFTINDRNYTLDNYDDIPGADEDINHNSAVDPIIAEGNYFAKVKFFAFADDNRMPIKRAMVNWGDGSNIYDRIGSSQNRKPYCATSDEFSYTYDSQTDSGLGRCAGTQLTCKSKEDCKFAGPNDTAVLCSNPSLPTTPTVVTKICQYQLSSLDPFYEGVCFNSSSCHKQGFTGVCVINSDPLYGNECEYTPNSSTVVSSDHCQTVANCPDISGTVKSCTLPTSPGQSTSSALGGHFGDSARACTDTYFELSHTYFCDPDPSNTANKYTLDQINSNVTVNSIGTKLFLRDVDAQEAYANLIGRRTGPEGQTELIGSSLVCVFKPAVQVLDNWGWCNGSCVRGYNVAPLAQYTPIVSSQSGCYENIASYIASSGNFASNVNQCSGRQDYPDTDPWLKYNGAIIVIP